MTEFEKEHLKEAICNMIDEGRTYGHIDTLELKENAEYGRLSYYDFNHKVWEISIKLIEDRNSYGN